MKPDVDRDCYTKRDAALQRLNYNIFETIYATEGRSKQYKTPTPNKQGLSEEGFGGGLKIDENRPEIIEKQNLENI